ncbi:MAG: hypothetical protein H7Z42_10230 [Roseiflexaceae bacterium]|nr:hypothetical protein [Roseiflexaceae bacterium]
MYGVLVTLHSVTRWFVIIAAVYALYVAFSGWFGRRAYGTAARRAGAIFGGITGIQFILGLLVYFWPTGLVMGVLGNAGMAGAMRNPDLRFYVVEHIVAMVVAVSLVHIGSAVAKRRPTDTGRFRAAAVFWSIGTLLILASIPWSRALPMVS